MFDYVKKILYQEGAPISTQIIERFTKNSSLNAEIVSNRRIKLLENYFLLKYYNKYHAETKTITHIGDGKEKLNYSGVLIFEHLKNILLRYEL